MRKFACILFLTVCAVVCEAAKKRVCIIGAGVSGLVTAKYFNEYPDEFETIVFEKNSDVGGMWIYTDSTTVDEHGLPVHSSIYKNLRTISPKTIMTFPDYPYFEGKTDKGSFVKHEDVLQYLKNYTDHFNLHQSIQFSTNVVNVEPLSNLRWLITADNLDTKMKYNIVCDAIVISNGHNVKGYVPKIPGIESFRGKVLHSHLYRKPEPFTNRTVVVLGASDSGIDIGIEISLKAKKVYLSHRHDKLPAVLPPNMEQVPGVLVANGSELILSNGTKLKADALVLCTGYVYDLPFLDKSSGIIVESVKYIHPLYKHLINIERPTMAIMAVPPHHLGFQTPHIQAKYFRAVLRGKLSLPGREQMLIDAKLSPNVPINKAHYFSNKQLFSYYDGLLHALGQDPMPWWYVSFKDEISELVNNDPLHFKDKRMMIHEDERRIEFV